MLNIAWATYRQLIRNKILGVLVLFSFLLIVLSIFISTLSLGNNDKILVDFGVAMTEVIGVILVIFLGSKIVTEEIQNKTIYLIISRPMPRSHYVLGKFLGFASVLLLILLVQGCVLAAIMWNHDIALSGVFFITLLTTYIRLLILLALVMFFSLFSSQFISIFVTLGIYFVAHAATTIIATASTSQGGAWLLKSVGWVIYVLFPNLEALNTKNFLIYHTDLLHSAQVLSWQFNFAFVHTWINILYGLAYMGVILFLSIKLFEHKTFES